MNKSLSIERIVADHLENTSLSLIDALNELGMDSKLADDTVFCTHLDFHITFCTECGYWYLPCLFMENNKGEDICENCYESND